MIKKYSIAIIFLILTITLFWQFFFKGLYPFPGNLLLGLHEPWRSEYFIDGRITISNKPVVDDAFKHIYPLRILSIDIFKKFELPLWNPYNGAGMPLLAGGNNGVLDPFNILFLFLPYPLAWSIYIILQPLLAGFCMYLYCRKISLSPIAALFASIAFMLSGFVTVKAIFSIYGLAIATLPLILYLVESYVQNGITKRTYLIPILIFTMIVTSLPQISLYIIVLTYLYFLFRIIQRSFDSPSADGSLRMTTRQVLPVTLLFTLGFGLSAMQILPTLELFQHSSINTQSSSFIIEKFLVPVQHLLSILIPNYFGNEALYNYWGYADYEQTIAAIGLLPCFFAFLGLARIKKILSIQLFFIVVAILTAALAVDWLGSRLFFSMPLPIISTAAPSRIFLLTTFAIAVLGGYGFDKWLKYKTLSKVLALKILLFLTAVGFILAVTFIYYHNNVPCRFGVITNCRIVALRNTILETSVFGATLVPFFLYFFLPKKMKAKNIAPLFILAIVTIIGIYNANKFFPYSPKTSFFPNHPLIEVLKEKTQYARFFGKGQAAFTPNIATQLRLYDPQYFHPLYIKRYRDLLEYANNGKYIPQLPRGEPHIRTESNPNPALEQRRERLLTLLGVSYLIFSKEEIPTSKAQDIIWENNNRYITYNDKALPRTYLTRKFEVLSSKEAILKKLFEPKFDAKSVVLEETPSFSFFPSADDAKDQAVIKKYSENSVVIITNTVSNAILVLSDNHYPGWKAYVDDKQTKIYRANYTFRAVEVPEGQHLVTFKYQPESFYKGLILSAASLFMLGLLFFIH